MPFQCIRNAAVMLGWFYAPNPAFGPMVLSESDPSHSIELHPFHCHQDGEAGLKGQSLLCPIRRTFIAYML